ncbi:hypothetical protein GCM10009634_77910 [Saccharothrix xinjiangensis]
MNDWAARPLDAVYAAVFPDAIHVKVRDGQLANRPVHTAIGATVDGRKDVLGLWMGTGGERAVAHRFLFTRPSRCGAAAVSRPRTPFR